MQVIPGLYPPCLSCRSLAVAVASCRSLAVAVASCRGLAVAVASPCASRSYTFTRAAVAAVTVCSTAVCIEAGNLCMLVCVYGRMCVDVWMLWMCECLCMCVCMCECVNVDACVHVCVCVCV
jgi:hypothetical protein